MALEFPLWLRVTHLLNFLFLGFLIRSGIEILASHPRLYFNDGCTPGSEWLKFTRRKVATNTDIIYTARDDEIDASPWLALPGHKNIGLARHWHGVVTMLWIITGFVYVALLFGTGEWRRLVPTTWDVFPRAWHSLLTYLSLHAPPLSDFQPYDGLQQLTYFGVVFLLGPLMIATGAAQSPAVIARFPRYSRFFGGRQNARSLHFLGMALFALFIVVHVVLVLLVIRGRTSRTSRWVARPNDSVSQSGSRSRRYWPSSASGHGRRSSRRGENGGPRSSSTRSRRRSESYT